MFVLYTLWHKRVIEKATEVTFGLIFRDASYEYYV